MTNEIKEILDEWKKFLSWCYENNEKTIEIHRDNVKKILDYITNLQEENERLTNARYSLDRVELEKRIDKANQLIEKHKRKDGFLNLNEWQTRDLLNILRGDE